MTTKSPEDADDGDVLVLEMNQGVAGRLNGYNNVSLMMKCFS